MTMAAMLLIFTVATLASAVRGDLLMDALSAFVDPAAIASDIEEMQGLAELASDNATNSSGYVFDNTFPLSSREFGLLLQVYETCGTNESLALRTWCTGQQGTSLGGHALCPPGVRTHPCSGRVLGTSTVEYLWPWQGVKCDAYTDPTTVTHIYLRAQRLKCRLQDLDFSHMVSLEQLDVGQNELIGPFPSWLGNMTVLRFLNLRENKLVGKVPLSFGDNINIEVLDLARNRLTATSLSFFQILKRLRYVDLAANEFNLSLPRAFFNAEYIEHVNLSHNAFYGPLPKIPRLKDLVTFDVANNVFDGPLPETLPEWGVFDPLDPSEVSLVRVLDFSNNRFNGSIPTIANHTNLQHFAVHANNFEGLLPALPRSVIRADTSQFLEGNDFLCPLPQLTPDPGDFGNLTCRCVRNRQSNGSVGVLPAAVGATQCQVCPPGSFANASTNFECTLCPPGFVTQSKGYQISAVECVACSPGTFSNATGGVKCHACPLGTFNAKSGQPECERCAPGTFTDQVGLTECERCPAGMSASVGGSSTCLACEPGTFAPSDGEISCLPCPRGHYQDQPAARACAECPPGHVAQWTGQRECLPCPAGAFYDAQARTCISCPSTAFTNASASLECQICPPGSTAEGFGSQHCVTTERSGTGRDKSGRVVTCAPGSFNNGNFVTCQPCPPGSFASTTGSTHCLRCARGSYTSLDRAATCQLAPVGAFVDQEGATRAERCSPGHYAPAEGSTSCVPCPHETTSVFGGSRRCEALADGEIEQRVSWIQVTLELFGVHMDVVARNGTVQTALLRSWDDALFANGVTGVAPHIVDVTADPATVYQPRVHIVLEMLAPKRPRRRPPGSALFSNLSQAYNDVNELLGDARDSTAKWLDAFTGNKTDQDHTDFARLPHANVTEVIPTADFQRSLARQLSHSAAVDLHATAALVHVHLHSSPFQSTRAIKCPRGTYFTNGVRGRECVLCPIGTYADEGGLVDACKLCPVRQYGDIEGLEECWSCPFGEGALPGSTSCTWCGLYSHECGDFWKNVMTTIIVGVAVGGKLWLRGRGMWRSTSGVQHTSEATALVASMRAFGRVPWESPRVDLYRQISVDTLVRDVTTGGD